MGLRQWTKWSDNFDSAVVGDRDKQEGGCQSVVASPICGCCFESRFPGPSLVLPGDTDSMKAPNFVPCLRVNVERWGVWFKVGTRGGEYIAHSLCILPR